jgi:hypothetical protein
VLIIDNSDPVDREQVVKDVRRWLRNFATVP